MFGLVARQTATFHRGPIFGVVDDGAVATSDPGKVVPVTFVVIERNVSVGEIQVQRAIVVQIAELRAKTPATELDAKIPRQILVLEFVAAGAFFGHPQIISLDEHPVFRNVGNINGVAALIENIAKTRAHSALGCEADAGLFADFVKALAVVEVQFGNAVIIRYEQIGVAGATQVRSGGSQSPAAAVDSEFGADFFKFSVAKIVKKIFSAAVFRVFKTVRHHLGGRKMPEVDVFGVVAADK